MVEFKHHKHHNHQLIANCQCGATLVIVSLLLFLIIIIDMTTAEEKYFFNKKTGCGPSDRASTDRVVAKLMLLGRGGRRLPENEPQLKKFCAYVGIKCKAATVAITILSNLIFVF